MLMGDPGRQRKKFEKPFRPFDKDRIEVEKAIMKEYGLRRKKELWRMEGTIRKFRRRARDLLAESDEKKEKELLEKLEKLGLLKKGAKLEDVLSLEVKDILERRLQTLVYKKGLANSVKQARQMIVHRHVRVDGRVIEWPSYLVNKNEEDKITSDIKVKEKKKGEKSGGKERKEE